MGSTVALDSGAIIALARGNAYAAAMLAAAVKDGSLTIVPAPALAETLRGGAADAAVHRVLDAIGCEVATSPLAARRAGALLGRHASNPPKTVDALIVETAIEHRADVILTQDAADITALAEGRLDVLAT